jgi:homoserine kinase type II
MAVFTEVGRNDLMQWLEGWEAGTLIAFEGIPTGIENTNYFVDTTAGRWVLTLFERMQHQQIDFCLRLTQRLARAGLPCPGPIPRRDGRLQSPLAGRAATLVPRLPGRSLNQPRASQCRAVGETLARMHLAARDLESPLPNPRGLVWCAATAASLQGHLEAAQWRLLSDELAIQLRFAEEPVHADLPRGPVHADLFRDNALFLDDTLSGVFDFYFAGVDTWMFDLAVTCNDWCIDEQTGQLLNDRLDALLAGYRAVRSPTASESQAWPLMLRAAALRFWLSRLADWHLPRPAHVLAPKDPSHFERILIDRRATHRTF